MERISGHPAIEFLWNASTLATEIQRRAEQNGDDAIRATCGQVARNLAAWFWSEMDQQENSWLVDVGSRWILPLVAKTYATNAGESRGVLEPALELVGKEGFPIGLVRAVVYDIDKIYPCDPEFAADVYRKVFSYDETSEETVHWGGHVISFTSTRRQDYHSCQYQLIEKFPEFLRSAPVPASRAAITCLYHYVVCSHIKGYLNEGATLEDLQRQFQFRGATATYISDTSFIWDASIHRDEPTKIADALFAYMGELAGQPEQRDVLVSLIDLFRDNLCVAFLWRRLLAVASESPDAFGELLFDLFLARPIQTGGETVHELGKFLEAAVPGLAPDRRRIIEDSLMSIPEGEDDPDESRHLERYRNRLLARIPRELLVTAEAKKLRSQMDAAGDVPENGPLVTFSSFSGGEYTTEMWLQEKGVDTTTPENHALLAFEKPLNDFHSSWLNEKPTSDAIRSTLPIAINAYNALRDAHGADEAVAESLLTKLGSYASRVARAVVDLDNDAFGFCREVLLRCSEHESPLPNPERSFDHPGWSPAPRTEAAEGLPWLAAHHPDDELLQAVHTLAADDVPAVRFLLLNELWRIFPKSPDAFWSLATGCAKAEDNQLVVHALLNSLSYVIAGEEDATVELLKHVTDRMLPDQLASETQEAAHNGVLKEMMPLVVWLVVVRGNSWAEQVVESLLRHPVCYAEPIEELTSTALQVYVFLNDGLAEEKTVSPAMSLVERAIDAACTGISRLRDIPQDQWNEDLSSRMRATYDVIDNTVRRFRFALKADDRFGKQATQTRSSDERVRGYTIIKPVLEQILDAASDTRHGVLFASTAHTFMELLNSILEYDPAEVLHMANTVVQSSKETGYHLDSMAIGEVVKLVETILADHRSLVREGDPLNDLLNLLDTFAEVGWSEALKLVWRLDEVFR